MSNLIIGLTGGIGSGKTTITNMFQALDIDIIDADIIAREVVAPKSYALEKIVEHFGNDYLTEQGQLNRAKLRSTIFSNQDAKQWLNNLLHPLIRDEIINQTKAANSNYCILVAPLLVENKLLHLVDRVLVIDVEECTQLKRTLTRDTSSADEIKAIMASQASRAQRLSKADDIIDNDSDNLTIVQQQVSELNATYHTLAAKL